MAALSSIAHSALLLHWGLRIATDAVHGYQRRDLARQKAITERFNVHEAEAIEADYLQGLAKVDDGSKHQLAKEIHSRRPITVYYRMLRGTHHGSGGTSSLPTMAPTSHWGVRVGDRFYELRQKDGIDVESSGKEVIDVKEGDKVKLAVIRDRIIVPGSKSIDVGETNLSDDQIMRRSIYIFNRLFATNYNLLIDNCQSFAIFLCQSIVDEVDRPAVREKLQSKSTLYSNVAVSMAVSAGYYLAAGLTKDVADMLTLAEDVSTQGGTKRIEGWKEGMYRAVDKKMDGWDKFYMHPEVFNTRRTLYSNVADKVGDGLNKIGDKLHAGAECLDKFTSS